MINYVFYIKGPFGLERWHLFIVCSTFEIPDSVLTSYRGCYEIILTISVTNLEKKRKKKVITVILNRPNGVKYIPSDNFMGKVINLKLNKTIPYGVGHWVGYIHIVPGRIKQDHPYYCRIF